MSTTKKNKIDIILISNPDVSSNEIKKVLKLKNIQSISGRKVSINKKKNELISYLSCNGISQAKFSKTLNLAQTTLSKFLNGKKISETNAITILNYFNKLENGKFQNFEGSNKNKCRVKMCNLIKESQINNGNILSLSSKDCLMELKLNKELKNDFHYVSYEYDKEYFLKMRETAISNNLFMSTNYAPISMGINGVPKNYYSHAILDYCGTFSTNKEDVKNTIHNDIVKCGGTIHLTVSKRDSKSCADFNKYLSEKEQKAIKNNINECTTNKVIRQDLIEIFKNHPSNSHYIIEETFNYRDTSDMCLIMIKRVS